MEKLESRAIIFQAFGGLNRVNMSAEQKCFSFNEILKQYQHHPSIIAWSRVQKTENTKEFICGTTQCLLSATEHTSHITDPGLSHWNNGGLAFLSKNERCNSTTFIWILLKQWPWVPVLSGGTIWLACISISNIYGLHSALKSGSKLPNPQQLFSGTSISYHSVSSIRAQ